MSTAADLIKDMESALGANADNMAVSQWIDTGYPPLNQIISGSADGGLPFGRLIEMYGESMTGKTALATKWMVQAQKMGGIAGFVDWERSFNAELAASFGLSLERPEWLYFKPKTWEEGNMKATMACKIIRESKVIDAEAPILFVFDSIAAAIPKSVFEKGIDELTMNDTTALARVSSMTLKTQASYAEEFNATFLYLNQVRLKPGVVYGDPSYTPGGKAMEFYASARLSLGKTKIVDESKEFVGQKIGIKAVKSKFTKPFQSCSLRMSFDEAGTASFDMTYSLLEQLIEDGLLVWSKPRVTWTDGTKYYVKALAQKLNDEGRFAELVAIMTAGVTVK